MCGVVEGKDGWLSQRAAAAMASWLRSGTLPEELLSAREYEVLSLAARGWTVARIATELEISERTVRFHLTNVYTKLGVQSFGDAALNHGLGDKT